MIVKKKVIFLAILIVAIAVILFWRSCETIRLGTTGSAQLNWNQNAEADLAGYKVYYGTSPRTADCPPGGYTQNANAGKNTKYTVTKLLPGQTYYFSVTSLNKFGKESCFSPEMKKTISRLEWLNDIFKRR